MSENVGGFWRRLVRRFTTDVAELDADDLSKRAQASGAQRACDCHCGEEAVVLGRLRSVGLSPKASAPTLEAELFDGTDGVILVWFGRRKIAGIEPGRTIKARGRVAVRDGQKVLYNPYYELQNTA